ncbi:MAG: ABC transporter ATP-binding protein [Actinomycetota bacterium]|nr:ABC transporter ATP-binding protein [Actinomycetota bacterium]
MNNGAVLCLENVNKAFGEEVTAVSDVTLAVEPGEFVLVMGPSGAGKTTLLQICGALLRPDSGKVWLGDTEVTGLTEKRLPAVRLAQVGFVFQAFQLLANLTALENVRLVLEAARRDRGEADSRARALLEGLGLADRLNALPATLSGGQKQRVAIARALANEPPLILADEPTGNLDSKTGAAVKELLHAAVKERGKSVLCVTHDTRVRDVADKVLWMEDGRLRPE